MKWYLPLGRVYGAPVLVHLATLLVFPYFYSKYDLIWSALASVCVVFLIFAHEMGHAFFANRFGYRIEAIKMSPLHGVCEYSYDWNWEPEPIIATGGILVQSIIFVIWLVIISLLQQLNLHTINWYLEPVSLVFLTLNAFTIVINLLPLPGLDGATIWPNIGRIKENAAYLWKTKRKRSKKEKYKRLKNTTNYTSEKVVSIKSARKNKN